MSNAPRPEAEPTWTFFLLVAVLAFFGWILWYMFRVQFLEALRYLRLSELFVIGLFSGTLDTCYDWLKQAPVGDVMPTVDNVRYAQRCFGIVNLNAMTSAETYNFYRLTGTSIGRIGHGVSYYLHIPLVIVFMCCGLFAVFLSPRTKFKTRHTLETFIKIQALTWPVIRPIVNFKPATLSARIPGSVVPDQLPAFAEALAPEEWIAWHQITLSNGLPERAAARRALTIQLGPRWNGIEGQPPYIRALFAAFALKGAQKREESDDLLGKLSACWTINGGFKMSAEVASEVERTIRDPAIGGEATKIAAKFAYRTTAMLGVLKWSRWMGGVLASAQFLWLRAVDRNLWYPMNNLGRRSFHVEGAGALAHFMAEENAKKPLPVPRVDTAIMALNHFLTDPEKPAITIPTREEQKA